MSKKLFTALALIVMLVVTTSNGYADKTQYNITISQLLPSGVWQIAPCPAPGTSGDTWNLINASPTIAIKVKIENKNGAVTTYDIPISSSTIHNIAVGDCEIIVFNSTGTEEYVECTGAYCGTIPTLTQWGIFVLIVLIGVSTVFIMRKRRKVTATA